jgi:alpha-L-rhamnosidase
MDQTLRAAGDGFTPNTIPIQESIDRLADDGGGTLIIPGGKFLSGAIFLKPKVNLHLERDAVLLGSPNIDDYPLMPTRIEGATNLWRPALLNAYNCDNLRISGQGTIQGGGKAYWDEFWRQRKANPNVTNLAVHRPRNIFMRDSRNVSIGGIALRDSGFWNLHLYRCQNVNIDSLDIRTPPMSPSTDGIDIDSCQDVNITHCYISVDDDNIAIKGTKGPLADQDKDSPANERIHIANCTFGHGHAAVTLGSEACHVKGVLVENCKIEDPHGLAENNSWCNTCLVKMKIRPDTPHHFEDIHFRNISMKTIGNFISIEPWMQFFNLRGLPEPSQLVENITVENVTGNAEAFGTIAGPPKSTIRHITLRNIDLKLKYPEVKIEKVQGLKIQNLMINGRSLG